MYDIIVKGYAKGTHSPTVIDENDALIDKINTDIN
jgi:hypothetical protein